MKQLAETEALARGRGCAGSCSIATMYVPSWLPYVVARPARLRSVLSISTVPGVEDTLTVDVERIGRILVISIQREEKRNALNARSRHGWKRR